VLFVLIVANNPFMLNVTMLRVDVLSVTMLSVDMLNVTMLSVDMLSVVAPFILIRYSQIRLKQPTPNIVCVSTGIN
jgi:hypothetical protein